MLTLYIDEKTTAGKSVIQFIKNLHAPNSAVKVKKMERELTDAEMALPGFAPTDAELEAWLDRPEVGRASPAEVVRKRLKSQFNQNKTSK